MAQKTNFWLPKKKSKGGINWGYETDKKNKMSIDQHMRCVQ